MDRLPGVTGTRRDLMRAALTTGAGAALAAGADAALRARPVLAAQAQTDAELVTTLLSTEKLAVFVYGHIIHAGLLTGEEERLARRLMGQERAHVRAMSAAAARLGANPPPPLVSIADADKLLAASAIPINLTQLHSAGDALRLVIHVEVVLQRSYYVGLGTLDDTELQHTSAQILAAEAQHSTVLIEALFPGDVDKAVPEPFVEGNPGDARV